MKTLHIDHLNRDYFGGTIQRWKDEGCYDSIARSLGYRYIAESARLPDSVKPGGILEIAFTIRNSGFGELFNPRPLEVTLSGPGGALAATLPEDPRLWSGGKTVTKSFKLTVPAGLTEGAYSVGLRMRDADSGLAKDVRYSIRFANTGVWEAATGINVLKMDLAVSLKSPGARDAGFTRFEVAGGSNPVRMSPRRAQGRRTWSAWMGLDALKEEGRDLRGRAVPR
jgi:hypothetical protein